MNTPSVLTIKRSSVEPITMKLLQGDGTAMPLTEASSIRFQMREWNGTELVMDRVATITDLATGTVSVTPAGTDTDTPGQYFAEWRISYAGGDVLVPNDGYIRVHIIDDLAPNV